MPNFMLSLLSWLALPVYIAQGLYVRSEVVRQIPGAGPTRFDYPGAEPEIRLLVLGDSTVAGVGVTDLNDGLAAQISALIAERTGRAVTCRAAGFNSAVAGDLRDHAVPNLAPEPWTHILVSVGVNDVKNLHTVGRFTDEFGGLLYALKAKWPDARVSWANVVDMRCFPALPALLAQMLEWRALLLNAAGARLCEERGAHCSRRLKIPGPNIFSKDGFHVGKEGYRICAQHLMGVALGEEGSRQ